MSEVEAIACCWNDYLWIVVVGGIASFACAWSIGANDVANAFGTSVGAKTLTLWQACLIAAVFELTGAIVLGSSTTETIAGNIAKPILFQSNPEIYMYGMLTSLIAATIWVTLATYFELAVSTTHSIIGAVMGFALVWGGPNAIVWADPRPNFPFYGGMVPIIISWFTSPVISCALAAFFFIINRSCILRRRNSVIKALWSLPLLVFVTVWIDLFFVLYKGAGSTLKWSAVKCIWVSVCAATGTGVVVAAFALPFLKKRIFNTMDSIRIQTLSVTRYSRSQSQLRDLQNVATAGVEVSMSKAIVPDCSNILHCASAEPAGHNSEVLNGQSSQASNLEENLPSEQTSLPFTEIMTKDSYGTSTQGVHRKNVSLQTPESSIQAGEAYTSSAPHEKHNVYLKAIAQSTKIDLSKMSSSDVARLGISGYGTPRPPHNARITLVGMYDTALKDRSQSDNLNEDLTSGRWMKQKLSIILKGVQTMALHGLVQDVHEDLFEDERVTQMHQASEIFEPETEMVYKYLQVLSACSVSFAHGANDVANAVGPYAAIWYLFTNESIPKANLNGKIPISCPKWILAIGGIGIVVGLSTYGYNIIRALGVKMAKITPSRGYCAELATALTVASASAIGLPISTTHCIVGAEVGVGICESLYKGVNWVLFFKTVTSWVFTMVVAGLMSAALFSQGAYAPSIMMAHQIEDANQGLYKAAMDNLLLINSSITNNTAKLGGLITLLGDINQTNVTEMVVALAAALQHTWTGPKDILRFFYVSEKMIRENSYLAPGFNVSAANVTQQVVNIYPNI